MQKKVKKDAFAVAVDGLLDGAFEGALNELCKHGQEATIKFENKQNIVIV